MGDLYLILENGAVFKGRSFGYEAQVIGELVFTTGMTGYLETLADPAYYGQIVLQTFPLIGNYGVISDDFGSGHVHMKAYIVREWCQEPSNFRSEGNLDSFLREMNIPGLCGIDTRSLTRILRENGVMNAMISKTPVLSEYQWAELREYRITGAVDAVCGAGGSGLRHYELGIRNSDKNLSATETAEYHSQVTGITQQSCGELGASKSKVVLWDFGDASRLAEGFLARGCTPFVVEHTASVDEVLSQNPDAVVLSGGPGNPIENTQIIKEIEKLCSENVPVFAIGLGHQMLALARGAGTKKLLFGHRGANQPVVELSTGRLFVTNQNHGYAVQTDSLPDTSVMSYINSNDGTCEGIDYKDIPAFSVQFTPTDEIYARFFAHLRNCKIEGTAIMGEGRINAAK